MQMTTLMSLCKSLISSSLLQAHQTNISKTTRKKILERVKTSQAATTKLSLILNYISRITKEVDDIVTALKDHGWKGIPEKEQQYYESHRRCLIGESERYMHELDMFLGCLEVIMRSSMAS